MPPRRRTAAAAKPAPAPEVIEDDELFEDVDDDEVIDDATDGDDLDLDEAEEDEPAPTPKPRKAAAKKTAAKAAPKAQAGSGFDSNWLATHVNENVDGSNLTARDVRMLLRKMAKNGDLAREVGTDRSRYDFPKGANDPVVKKVIIAVKKGELAAEKKAGLDNAKAAGAAKRAAAKATPAKAAAKAAPAKATTTTRRRRTASA